MWLRNELETFRKRLKALEAKTAEEALILTEDQIRALERAKEEKKAHGEIETMHPGYLGAQDTYVGTIKGVGQTRRSASSIWSSRLWWCKADFAPTI